MSNNAGLYDPYVQRGAGSEAAPSNARTQGLQNVSVIAFPERG